MRKIYKLKHKPTGLYYVKSGYGHLSDKGSIYTTGVNSLSGRERDKLYLCITDQKLIKEHLDVLQRVGKLEIDNDFKTWNWRKRTHETITFYRWSITACTSDFEKEIVGEIA